MDIERALITAAVTAASIIFIYQATQGTKEHAMERSNSPASQSAPLLDQ
jgi:hypothetical protein